MGRSRTGGGGDYELKATFTATADTSGLEAMEKKIASIERRMKRFNKMSATATVSEKGADVVEDKINNIEKKLKTFDTLKAELKMEASGEDAVEAKLDKMERHANEMSKRIYRMQFEARTEQDQAKIENLGRTADNVTREARILRIMAQHFGFDAVGRQISELNNDVAALSKQRATVHADMRGYNEVMQGIDGVERNLKELTARPWDAEIRGDASHAQRVLSQIATQARAQFARAYRLQIKAETLGFTDAAAKADALKREMLNLSQQRARVAVELEGASPAIAGLLTVKRAAESAEGGYTIRIDYSRIMGAVSALGVFGAASKTAGAALGALGSAFRNANGGMGMLIRVMQGAMAIVMGLSAALLGIAVVSAGPLVAGFTIAAGALAMFVGGLGLVAAVAAPVISALSNYEQNTKKVETTQKAATASSNALAQAEQQLAKANEGVAKAVRTGEQAITSAIEAHEEAVRGVGQARKAYDQAVRGVQDAEIQGEESIASAVRAHEQAVEAVGDAYRNVDKAVQAAADAEIDAQENIRQAIKAHDNALRGLDDAYRAYDKAAQAVIDAEIDAQENVRQAINAHDDAIKGLAYAQQDYQLAQQESTDAQEELTRATEEYNDALATEEQRLLGLRYDLEGLGINQRQLALDIADAAKDIRTAENSDERARAALRYEELLLRQKQGVLSIAEAQRRLQESQLNGTDQLQSAYDNQQGAIEGVNSALRGEQRAADGVQDAYEQYGETAAGITRAQVEGARSVRDANESLADAVRGIGDAQDDVYETSLGIQKAQVDGARSIADAQQGIIDAQRDLNRAIVEEGLAQEGIGKARTDAARAISDAQDRVLDAQLGIEEAMRREAEAARGIDEARLQAQEGYNDALQAVADAQRQVAEATEANRIAQNALNEAMADMPSEKITALRDAWKGLWEDFKARTYDAREAIIDFGIELAGLSSGAIPHLADAANATTYALIQGFRDVIALWQNTGVFDNIITILGKIPSITQNMFVGMGGILGGLINVLTAALPFIDQFSLYIKDIGERFATWSNSAEGREQLRRFFESAAVVLPALWGFIYDIGAALVNWSTQNPNEVLMIVNALSEVVSGAFWGIAAIVQGLIAFETAVPGISRVLGAIIAIGFATLLIPKSIRTALFDLAKFSIGWTSMGDEAAKGAGKAGDAAAGIGPKLKGIGSAIVGLPAMFAAISAPVWIVVAAVAALAAAAYLIYQNWDWIGPYFWALWDGIVATASAAWAYISDDIYAAGAAVWSFLTTQWGYISQWWGQIMSALGIDASISWTGIYDTVMWAVSGIGSIISWIGSYIGPLFAAAWDGLVLIVSGAWNIISGIVSGALQVVMGVISVVLGTIMGDWDLFWSGLGWIVSGFGTAINGIVTGVFQMIGGVFYSALAALESYTGISFTSIYNYIASALSDAWGIVVWVFQGIWEYLFGGSIIPDIVNAFYNSFWTIYSYIADPLQAAWDFMTTGWYNMWNLLSTIFWGIVNLAYQTFWGIYSTIEAVVYGVQATNDAVWNAIWTTLDVIWYGIWALGESIFWGIYDTIVAVWDWVWGDTDATWNDLWSTLSGIWSGVYDELGYIFTLMYEYIASIWSSTYDYTADLWSDIWTYISDTWSSIYDTAAGWLDDLSTRMYDSWVSMWEGVKAFGGWIGETLDSAFGTAIKTALDWLSTLLYGAQKVLDAIGDPGGWSSSVGEVAAAIDYYHDGGIKVAHEMANGGITTRDRGGIGTDHPNDQLVVWNEQVGNEAWIAERGPEAANLGYLDRAASWFDMAVVPQAHIAERSHKKEETNKQVHPPPFNSLAGGAGTGDKRKMMAEGGVLYAAHGATLPWGSGLTSQTAKTAEEIYNDNDYGSLYYNSYYGHPDGYPEREQYSVDWWDSYRGGQLPTGTGDSIVSDAEGKTDFSYWIWNGSDSYDGSIGAADPHYDHAHTTFMPGLDLGSGSGAGGYLRRLAKAAIETFMPDVPDFGEGMVPDAIEGIGNHIRKGAIDWIMSLLPKSSSGPATTAEVEEWVTAGLEFGNAFEANAQNIADMASRAMQESTGDPNAINDYDINAQNGDPSKGLMQVTGASWSDHRAMYGEDAGNFDSNWSDPVMNSAVASRHMKNRYGYVVGANGSGYANGGVATGPQLGLIGEAGNELMIPLDDPNAVNMLARAFSKTDPVRNRATEYASSRTEVRDNIIQSGVEEVMEVGITGGEALIAEKIDNMKDELKDEIIASFAETELGDATLDRMVKTAVATALAVVSSRGARDLIDESVGSKLEFDTDMSR